MSGQEPEEATMWTRKEINIFKETIRQGNIFKETIRQRKHFQGNNEASKAFFEEKSVKHQFQGNDTQFLIV